MFVHSSQFQCEEMRKDVAALARRTPTGTAFMRPITYRSHAVTSKAETADVLLPQAVLLSNSRRKGCSDEWLRTDSSMGFASETSSPFPPLTSRFLRDNTQSSRRLVLDGHHEQTLSQRNARNLLHEAGEAGC
jgi:hypothetical protein